MKKSHSRLQVIKGDGLTITLYPIHILIAGIIKQYVIEHGYNPSQKEIAQITGFSKMSISKYFREMKKLGSIQHENEGKYRAYKLIV